MRAGEHGSGAAFRGTLLIDKPTDETGANRTDGGSVVTGGRGATPQPVNQPVPTPKSRPKFTNTREPAYLPKSRLRIPPALTPHFLSPSMALQRRLWPWKSSSSIARSETTSRVPSVWRTNSCSSNRKSAASRWCRRAAAALRSASMASKSIPSCSRGNSPIPTPSSRPCGRDGDAPSARLLPALSESTSNIQHRTTNAEQTPAVSFRRSVFDVGCSVFPVRPTRRVMGAWWPSRSSKPLSARLAGRGVFDSLPLRQDDLRFEISDLRIRRTPVGYSRKSAIVNRKSPKGGEPLVARADS